MNTGMMELNMKEMEAVNGGNLKTAIVFGTMGAGIGGTLGSVAGMFFGPVGAFVGAIAGAAALGTVSAIAGYKDEDLG